MYICFFVSRMVPNELDDIFADWGYQHFAKTPTCIYKLIRMVGSGGSNTKDVVKSYAFDIQSFRVYVILLCSALVWGGSHRLRASMCRLSCERYLVDQRFEGSCVDSWLKFVDSCDLSPGTLLIL